MKNQKNALYLIFSEHGFQSGFKNATKIVHPCCDWYAGHGTKLNWILWLMNEKNFLYLSSHLPFIRMCVGFTSLVIKYSGYFAISEFLPFFSIMHYSFDFQNWGYIFWKRSLRFRFRDFHICGQVQCQHQYHIRSGKGWGLSDLIL